MSERLKEIAKEAVIQIGAGGSAGFVEVCIMHPLDLVKTRMQLQSAKTSGNATHEYYDGVIDCFRKMHKHEGILSFYKGILPPILAETPKRAVKFFTFEQYKKIFSFGAPEPTVYTLSLAGAGAGITEAFFVNPFEVVKVSLQSDRSKSKDRPTTWSRTREIIKTGGFGLNGLNKGLSGTIARNGVFNMIYFGFYHSVKGYLPEAKRIFFDWNDQKIRFGLFTITGKIFDCLQKWMSLNRPLNSGLWDAKMKTAVEFTGINNNICTKDTTAAYLKMKSIRKPNTKGHVGEFFRKLAIGFVSGTLASCANIPFDVAKSRIQGPQPVPGQVKYKRLFPTMRLIWVEEGWRALYKGLLPKVLRLGPGGAIMLVVYDYMHAFLLTKFS